MHSFVKRKAKRSEARGNRQHIMRITINGETKDLSGVKTVEDMVARLELQTTQVAIERNRQIVPRATYGQALLADGDEIEIVRFIGGG